MEKKEIFIPEFEKGKPKKPLNWKKFENLEELLKYLKTTERYWLGEGYGSEKRKTPA